MSIVDEPWECSVQGCTNTTEMQTKEERRFDITLCDIEDNAGHFPEFRFALDQGWGEAKRWVAKYCEPRV